MDVRSSKEIQYIGELIFENRLAIPILLKPTLDDQGRKVFDLTFTTGEVEFIEGKLTETRELNEPYLSPILRPSRGDEVVINVTNGIEEDTSLRQVAVLKIGLCQYCTSIIYLRTTIK